MVLVHKLDDLLQASPHSTHVQSSPLVAFAARGSVSIFPISGAESPTATGDVTMEAYL